MRIHWPKVCSIFIGEYPTSLFCLLSWAYILLLTPLWFLSREMSYFLVVYFNSTFVYLTLYVDAINGRNKTIRSVVTWRTCWTCILIHIDKGPSFCYWYKSETRIHCVKAYIGIYWWCIVICYFPCYLVSYFLVTW